ncbi:high mobility group B protein 7 [Tanacetum coccineum]
MAYQTRSRKRVNALRRGPDGSAFQTCESCGVLVAVALVDMHECECEIKKVGVKKAKGEKVEMYIWDDKRESFMQDCNSQNFFEMDREGFETWKNMSSEEKLLYKLKAKKVDDDHNEKLLKESEDQMYSYVDEEADSAEVGKFDKNIGSYVKDTYDSDYDYDSDHDGSLYHQIIIVVLQVVDAYPPDLGPLFTIQAYCHIPGLMDLKGLNPQIHNPQAKG